MIDFYVEMLASYYAGAPWFKKWARNQITAANFDKLWAECKMEERIEKLMKEDSWYKQIEFLSKFFFKRLTGIDLYIDYAEYYPQNTDILKCVHPTI